jgi:hypothetical protein
MAHVDSETLRSWSPRRAVRIPGHVYSSAISQEPSGALWRVPFV